MIEQKRKRESKAVAVKVKARWQSDHRLWCKVRMSVTEREEGKARQMRQLVARLCLCLW
jgi:hypothetical protein